jgi:DNA-binding winged helix-turn-helix (wHTH) protein/TolB-like protein
MEAPVLPKRLYRFGLFQVDSDCGKLLRQGVPVRLQEQPLRVLCLLLDRPGEIVSREELRQSLWPEGTYVEFDGSLNAALKRLRFALGDAADNPIFIETVPRRGYRFIAPVEREQAAESAERVTPSATVPVSAPLGNRPVPISPLRFWPWWALAALALVVSFAGWRYPRKKPSIPPPSPRVIAVLPFSNQGAGPDFDYLRYAIANDLVTDLTYTHSVSVRPFASTSRYGSQLVDPEAVGKELRVTHVVAGGFLLDKQNLRINLELIDVQQNQPVWREEIAVPPQQLVALHDQLADRAAKGLLPAINVPSAFTADVPAPRNEHALDLFLHSLTIPLDPEPNQLAIQKLEESVALDSGYAPAWGELARRYGIDYQYGSGGEAAAAKALAAYGRQSELDPNWPNFPTPLRVERGDLTGAYDQAADFLHRHPDVALGHHSMSYVLRFAGLLDEANQQCKEALALDPGFNGFRSCAVPYILQGDYAHAQPVIQLDGHSGFGATLRMTIALRTGNTAAALAESDAASRGGFQFTDLLRIYLNHAPEADLRKAAVALEADPRSAHDPETLYFNAAFLSFCGQGDAALRQLRKAIKGNYCSYPAMDKDPLFDPIRRRPEFTELRQAGIQCQQNFLAYRGSLQ